MGETTTIQVSMQTKAELEKLKEMEGAKTYEELFKKLLHARKKNIPSTFGCLEGAPAFVRDEEEDLERLPH
jgi:predicted CopG family antitoxin